MRTAYPIIMTPHENRIIVYVPDFEINTEGYDVADAIAMARDAISLTGITMEDMGKAIPVPGKYPDARDGSLVTYVDVDFERYRKAHETRVVRKNVTIPSYLNDLAEREHINFSGLLQEAIKAKLGLE